ncbi:hypothetical protein [uncultured Amnibacterium sp.]|uniref:hypothetical protein n=1 Tax=uncultured Amnibacterium sp. TaxID=1631851 RepID=UPI0035CB52BB
MDLFVFVQKLNVHGTPLAQFTVPNQGAMLHDLTERGAATSRAHLRCDAVHSAHGR